jgi:iron complex outermembrane receptor protein
MFKSNQLIAIPLVLAAMFVSNHADAIEIEEIVVTAERREASVQDTPVAVSAYGEQQMEVLQIENTIDLINVVPNLFGGNNTGLGTANMYYLRGQGNDESISTFDPPVGTYVDDVYVTRQNANNFALFDVERIEVLRGPQGTLYGRNTTGGAIALIMKKPAEEFGGYAEVGLGRFSKSSFKASLDIPLTDTFLTKLSAYSVKDDGYLKNTAVNQTFNAMDNKGVRLALRSLISDNVTWDLTVDASEISYANVRGALVGSDRVSTAVATINQVFVGGSGLKSNGYGNDVENVNFTSNVTIEGDNGVTNIIIGKRSMDQKFLLNFPNGLSDDFFAIDNDGEHDMESVELKWTGEFYGAIVTSGIFFMNEDNVTDFADYLDFGGIGLGAPGAAIVNLADRVLENGTDSK